MFFTPTLTLPPQGGGKGGDGVSYRSDRIADIARHDFVAGNARPTLLAGVVGKGN